MTNILMVAVLFGLAVWIAFDVRRPLALRTIGSLIFSAAGWIWVGTHFG